MDIPKIPTVDCTGTGAQALTSEQHRLQGIIEEILSVVRTSVDVRRIEDLRLLTKEAQVLGLDAAKNSNNSFQGVANLNLLLLTQGQSSRGLLAERDLRDGKLTRPSGRLRAQDTEETRKRLIGLLTELHGLLPHVRQPDAAAQGNLEKFLLTQCLEQKATFRGVPFESLQKCTALMPPLHRGRPEAILNVFSFPGGGVCRWIPSTLTITEADGIEALPAGLRVEELVFRVKSEQAFARLVIPDGVDRLERVVIICCGNMSSENGKAIVERSALVERLEQLRTSEKVGSVTVFQQEPQDWASVRAATGGNHRSRISRPQTATLGLVADPPCSDKGKVG